MRVGGWRGSGRARAQAAGQRRTSLLRRRRRTPEPPRSGRLRREMIGGCMGFIDFIVGFVSRLGMGNNGFNGVIAAHMAIIFVFKKFSLFSKTTKYELVY